MEEGRKVGLATGNIILTRIVLGNVLYKLLMKPQVKYINSCWHSISFIFGMFTISVWEFLFPSVYLSIGFLFCMLAQYIFYIWNVHNFRLGDPISISIFIDRVSFLYVGTVYLLYLECSQFSLGSSYLHQYIYR